MTGETGVLLFGGDGKWQIANELSGSWMQAGGIRPGTI